ncbi:transglycosylase SLT domain-containing protein [Jhaorihella thermophila]|uniref:Transglycosylase SLT domain-containing protein n=1 Tax=Jhaorihella thermophila TaxID=488547 RepID=A0A1H5XQH9_9RHOB|nr:transglycosylase SLT domain-containing protein [Jhaorihella thermophila]SEG14059.1 Transglycosylase SLT domain-containing protein [Jhaorihella thermophila]
MLAAIIAPAEAAPDARTRAVCDRAANRAARQYGVPADVMLALTRTETGRAGPDGLYPWPWTVNLQGKGFWFDSAEEVRAFVRRSIRRGALSFDVGCFQINYKWHGDAFASVEDMIDPWKNATYAARFLAELHRELGDWTQAAGAYHSRTARHAKRYVRRFERIRATLPKGARRLAGPSERMPLSGLVPAAARTDGPLRSGGAPLGSLVPTAAADAGASLPLISMNERTGFGDFIRD